MSGAESPSGTGRILAYLGGIRSGKSALAQARFSAEVERLGLHSPAYLGTLLSGEAGEDPELARRLAAHRAVRPWNWSGIEVGRDLEAAAALCARQGHDAWLLDGLGAWAALNLDQGPAPHAALRRFLELARRAPLALLVLDEVGQGGVGGNPAARAFADLNGELNQAVFASADEAWTVQAGIGVRVR